MYDVDASLTFSNHFTQRADDAGQEHGDENRFCHLHSNKNRPHEFLKAFQFEEKVKFYELKMET